VFLRVAFFVKYSLTTTLSRPTLRVALVFLPAYGLSVGGVGSARKNYPALPQTLCATAW